MPKRVDHASTHAASTTWHCLSAEYASRRRRNSPPGSHSAPFAVATLARWASTGNQESTGSAHHEPAVEATRKRASPGVFAATHAIAWRSAGDTRRIAGHCSEARWRFDTTRV